MQKKYLNSKDKVVLKNTRDGAVEENLATGETERISKRVQEAELVKKANKTKIGESDAEPEKNQARIKRRQSIDEKTAVEQSSAAAFDEIKFDTTHIEQTETPTEVAEIADAPTPLSQDNPVKKHTSSHKIEKLERKAEKTHRKLDKSYDSLPKKKVLKSERVFDEDKGKAHQRLYFEEEIKTQKPPSRLRFEAKKVVTQAGGSLVYKVHSKIHEVEQDNSAVEAAHRSELVAESAIKHVHINQHKKSPYEKHSKLEQETEKTDRKLHFQKTAEEHPELKEHHDMNKFYQKSRNKKTAKQANESYDAASGSAEKIKTTANKITEKIKEFFKENKILFAWLAAGLLIIILCSAAFSSCTAMLSQVSSDIAGTTYLSEDEEMLGAENTYKALEDALQSEIDSYESTHSYDEYIYNLDDIYHDPYVLISLLSAMNDGEFELSEVSELMSSLFETQYELSESVTVETRYRTETQIEWRIYIDPYTGQPTPYPVEVEIQVPYDWYICTVTLTNADLDAIARGMLDEDQMLLYEAYLETKGNREDLFG